MNILVEYLYRDATNTKQFGSVVFTNPEGLDLQTIRERMRKSLIDGEYFYPDRVGIRLIYAYAWDPEIDHTWYEFENVSHTDSAPTDPRTADQFLLELTSSHPGF
ncbi:MAG: hypothetical protein HUU10_07020 [Bacteroidetes bacterium]|nr:hypothetical protein [Bacteroidota bacterium]